MNAKAAADESEIVRTELQQQREHARQEALRDRWLRRERPGVWIKP